MRSSDDYVRVLKFLRLEDPPEKADVIFVLGASTFAPVIHAAELYHDDLAPQIAFISTGRHFGGDKIWGIPEHVKYHEVLNGLKVPDKSILSTGLTTKHFILR